MPSERIIIALTQHCSVVKKCFDTKLCRIHLTLPLLIVDQYYELANESVLINNCDENIFFKKETISSGSLRNL